MNFWLLRNIYRHCIIVALLHTYAWGLRIQTASRFFPLNSTQYDQIATIAVHVHAVELQSCVSIPPIKYIKLQH